MNVTSIKSYNGVFKQNSKNVSENKANKSTIDNACSDEFISSKNKAKDNKKNNTWKWLLSGVITAALIIGLYIEKKTANAAKAEKEAAEKAKKELEERFAKEKEELEKKLKEEKKKWDDFFKNDPANKETPLQKDTNPSMTGNNTTQSNYSSTMAALQENASDKINENYGHPIVPKTTKTNLDNVVGYAEEKQFITDKLITPILENRENDIPNMFILYGPPGSGKTYMMNAFIKDSKFNVIEIENQFDLKANFLQLENAVKQSVENYNKTRERSVILLDDYNGFFCFNDNETVKSYKDIIENLSKNHATLISITNHPQDINHAILNSEKCEKLYLPSIKNEELPVIIKHCAKGMVDESINYQELAQIIINNSNENAYTVDKIAVAIKNKYHAINNFSDTSTYSKLLLNQQDLVEEFGKLVPNISKEQIDICKTFLEKGV